MYFKKKFEINSADKNCVKDKIKDNRYNCDICIYVCVYSKKYRCVKFVNV